MILPQACLSLIVGAARGLSLVAGVLLLLAVFGFPAPGEEGAEDD